MVASVRLRSSATARAADSSVARCTVLAYRGSVNAVDQLLDGRIHEPSWQLAFRINGRDPAGVGLDAQLGPLVQSQHRITAIQPSRRSIERQEERLEAPWEPGCRVRDRVLVHGYDNRS